MTAETEPSDNLSTESHWRPSAVAILLSLFVAVLIVSPSFWLGNASGHDIQFHAGSWLDAAGQWREGILFPRWTEWANHGFGEPRFIFYPPLSWLLGAALGVVVPWNWVPVAFIVLVETFAGWSAYALARRMLPQRAALFGAVCYVANPNALLIIYTRSDFAELLATAFFPLVILAAMQVAAILENRARNRLAILVLFSALFAAVWLSNAPAGVMMSYTVALLFAWAAWERKSWKPILAGGFGIVLGFGLAAFYIIPAAYEQRWVNIAQALSSGLLPTQNFLYTDINDPEHNVFNWVASTAAILLIVVTGLASLAARRTLLEEAGREKIRVWRALLLVSATATVLMLRFTWPLWHVLPKLRFVQFPWRWMSIVALAFSFFLAGAAARKRFAVAWVVVICVTLAGAGVTLAAIAWWDTEDIPTLQAGIAQDQGFDGTDEYDPQGDDHYSLPVKAPRVEVLHGVHEHGAVAETRVAIVRWKSDDREIHVHSRVPMRLAVRLLNYPAWLVTVNGVPVKTESSGGETNQMVVPVAAGDSVIAIRFGRTLDRTIGGEVSLLSLIGALLLWYWPAKNQGLLQKTVPGGAAAVAHGHGAARPAPPGC